MRNYKEITFWENRTRQELLNEFINNINQYFKLSDFDPYQQEPIESSESLEVRTKLNKKIGIVNRIMYGAHVFPNVTYTPPSAVGGYVQNINIIENFALLYQFRIPPIQVIDVLEKAVGVYEDDFTKSIVRTFNPLFWAGRLIGYIASIPFKFLGSIGLPENKIKNSFLGKLLKTIIEALLWIITTFSTVWEFLKLIGVLKPTDTPPSVLQSVFQ